MKRIDSQDIKKIVSLLSKYDNPSRDGLKETPARFIKAWNEMLAGYQEKPEQHIKTFNEGIDQLICLRNIDFVSVCEHHLLPFMGTIDIAYIPDKGKIIGISKLGRIVDSVTKKLQIQERIVKDIADVLDKYLKPKGVVVIADAIHLCMAIRGVKKQNVRMTNSEVRGIFRKDISARMEALELLKWR